MRRQEEGFTLLEVMIAVFLLALILGAVYTAFFVINDAATTTGDTVVRLQEARTTLDLMRREIESASGGYIEILDRDVYGRPASVFIFETWGSALPGGARVLYSIMESEDEKLTLLKRVAMPGADIEGEDSGAAEVEAVEDVVSFKVEAQNRGKWFSTWREDTWPEMLRVTLTMRLHGAETPLSFMTKPVVKWK